MTLSEELQWRGFIKQATYKDIKELDESGVITFYHGFDASAPSQTIGNLAAMMADLVFMRHGHKAIILAGGSTSLVGDPGGKGGERQLQAEEVIASNVAAAQEELEQIYSEHEFTLVNNIDWTKDVKLLDFLRNVGKNVSVGDLIKKDFIASRLGEGTGGISYAEFSYTLLQGFDYLHLFDEYGVTLQLGGSDQWGNCLSGVELIRRMRGAETNVMTLPLVINKSTGKKFGKSEDGAVWLNPIMTSPYKYYQFWLNTDDEGVGDYIKFYTPIAKEQFDELMSEFNQNKAGRSAQKYLARESTKIVHGESAVESVERVNSVLFGGSSFAELSSEDVEMLAAEIPTTIKSVTIIEALVKSGVCSSNGEARRLIKGGAISFNEDKISNEDYSIESAGLIKKGKNTFILAR